MTPPSTTFVDLFCGAGGLSLGFHAAGGRLLAAADHSEAAGRTLRANFERLQPGMPPRVFSGDEGNLEDLDLDQVASRKAGPDILVGGPPCQGFSRIGRAKLASLADDPEEEDPRNSLYERFVDAARFWRPLAMLMENVPGMLSLHGENVAETVAEDLARCGYLVGYALLNAAWYGVPQLRERIFFIGIRADLGLQPSVPNPTHHVDLPSGYQRPRETVSLTLPFMPHFELQVRMAGAMKPAVTVRDAIGDLPVITEHLLQQRRRGRPGDFREFKAYDREPVSDFGRLMRCWNAPPSEGGVRDHVIRQTPRDFETFRRMKPEDRYPEALRIARDRLNEELERKEKGGTVLGEGTPAYDELCRSIVPPYPEHKFVDKWRKLNPDRPSWTVPAHLSRDAYSHIHYDGEQGRGISVREAARLQSFPDTFEFTGNMGDCFTQIGNAVPPVMAWVLASHLLVQLGRPSVPCPLSLP